MNYDKHCSTAKEQADQPYLFHAILNIVDCVLNQLTTKPTSELEG